MIKIVSMKWYIGVFAVLMVQAVAIQADVGEGDIKPDNIRSANSAEPNQLLETIANVTTRVIEAAVEVAKKVLH